MKVSELIAILQTLDPSAQVVTSTNDEHVLELKADDVQTVALREVVFTRPWFDPDHGAKLFKVEDDGPTSGVMLNG